MDEKKMYEPDLKLKPGSMKWQAAPGWLFCRKVHYEPNTGRIILPGQETKENTYRVMSVGPDVEGYKEGDIIAMAKGAACQSGTFIHVKDVLGRLVPNDAPNSAVGVTATRAGAEIDPSREDGKSIVDAMTAAD